MKLVGAELEDICPKCQGPMSIRPYRDYPVWSQLFFGLSFVIFLFVQHHLIDHRWVVWIWCAIQVGLGVLLVRGRLLARKRVYRCIRCSADLP